MDHQESQDGEYNDVVTTLCSMFGDVITREAIFTVVESYGGNLNLAAEAIIKMSDIDKTGTVTEEAETNLRAPILADSSSSTLNSPTTVLPSVSYAGISRSTGAIPKRPIPSTPRATPSNTLVWTNQTRDIISAHNQGIRVLILMRGLSGSGKTHLSKQIVEMCVGAYEANYKMHIYSTDDYFMVRGQYQYQKQKLAEAHDWNQKRVRSVLRQGLSPVIVDNTNIEIWEMEPYVREGVRNGYIIEVVEPNTPWARKLNQLLRRGTHNVPAATIKRKLESYQNGVTGDYLIKFYGLSYPGDKVPPVLRTMPEYIPPQACLVPRPLTIAESNVDTSNVASQGVLIAETKVFDSTQPQAQEEAATYIATTFSTAVNSTERIIPIEIKSEQGELASQSKYLEIQKQLEEIEKVEHEWDNGEEWSDVSKVAVSNNDAPTLLEPRPQRRTNSDSESSAQSTPRETLLETVQMCDDWRKISLFMPPWTDEPAQQVDECTELPVRETMSTGTCVEVGDTNLQNPSKILKVVTATPRDINLFNISIKKEKIPEVRMLDKSSMTNELLITEACRCKNEEQHFTTFRKLFKNIPRTSLRDIFDKCCGDVNWAVDIVLNGMADNQLELLEGDDISDTEDETDKLEQCNCLAAYQIVPDMEPEPSTSTVIEPNIPSHSNELNLLLPQKKAKAAPSDSTLQLKRDIERNIVISDDHYSKHALKFRKWYRGEYLEDIPIQNTEDIPDNALEAESNISKNNQQTQDEAAAISDDEVSNSSSMDEAEKTVNVVMTFEFITQLDNLFGRQGMVYPEKVEPRINIPVSLLNEINAFWMESLMSQLDAQQRERAKMLEEEADLARKLENTEDESCETQYPDFKEIMDMDFALSLYQKDVAEWKTKEPTDLAAKLTRDKLYNLFPDVAQDILSELLMAHDNNFQVTVEVLLISTGNGQILEDKNGLSKFVMKKEMERREKILEEEKKALSEVEWPLLPAKGEKVDLSVVENYRVEADKHLTRRNLNYQKAQEYIRRGMTEVAIYYSDIASFHKQKFEQANSLAAASLIQVHASNNPDNATIDLHYLRVGEAKETLDLFLDSHIQKLRESNNKKVQYHTLFFITGRGLHSNGRPRVKPAVKKRLRERGLAFSERNPGLLTAKVCAADKLSYQVQTP